MPAAMAITLRSLPASSDAVPSRGILLGYCGVAVWICTNKRLAFALAADDLALAAGACERPRQAGARPRISRPP
jgi:hypothetical protein